MDYMLCCHSGRETNDYYREHPCIILEVLSPSNLRRHLFIVSEPVSFLRRLGAMFYDGLLFGGTVLIVGGILATVVNQTMGTDYLPPGSLAANSLFIVYILLFFLLFGWFWTHGGQTLGMRAWKIRVVTYDEQPLNWQQALFRFVSSLVSWLVFGAGFLIVIFDPEKLGWHDRFSRTKLVRVG